jgi:hypothetical protein
LSRNGAEKLLETAFPIDMHVDLYSCLAGELGSVFTVAHRNIVMDAYRFSTEDSDITSQSDCAICDIPTKYGARGIIVVNLPIVFMGMAVLGGMYYLATRRRRF